MLQVGSTWLDASRARDRKELTHVLRFFGSVRALAHDGQAVLLTRLLAELDREQQAAILESPYAVYDLTTCGAATETAALVTRLSAAQQTWVLCSDGAVAGFVRQHRDMLWSWLGALPPSAHALILSAKGAIDALVVGRDSAAKVAGLIEALDPSAQFQVLKRTDAIHCLVHHGQSERVLALLAGRSGAELGALLPGCGAMQRLAAEGHVGVLAELVSSITPAGRANILADWDGVLAFLDYGRRALVKQWLLALDVEAQSRLFGSGHCVLRQLLRRADRAEIAELTAALSPAHSRALSLRLRGIQLGAEEHGRVADLLEWLEGQPAAGHFSISDAADRSALARGAVDGVHSARIAAAIAKLTLDQRAQLLAHPCVVPGLARGGAAAATAQLVAELPPTQQLQILLEPSAIASLAREGAAAVVVRMIDALPAAARVRLFREVRGGWAERLWTRPLVAAKLAESFAELDAPSRFELLVASDNAALLAEQGHAARVIHVLDAAEPEQRARLLVAPGLVTALCRLEGLSAVAARFEALPPPQQLWLLTQRYHSLTDWAAEGLAPTLFRMFAALAPAATAGALDAEMDPLFDGPDPLIGEWRRRLTQPANQRLQLVIRSST